MTLPRRGALAALVLVGAIPAGAAEPTAQPYIDQLKAGLEPGPSGSYTQELKKRLPAPGEGDAQQPGSYIEHLKSTDPVRPVDPEDSYIEGLQDKLGPAPQREGAIAEVKAGTSQLKPRVEGEVHYAAGFRLGTSASRTIRAVSGATTGSIESYYGTGWVPDLQIFGEWQPFHSEWLGNIGLMASGGFTYQSGTGNFAFNLVNPVTSVNFGTASRTTLKFLTFPVVLGVNYRFNLLRFLRPYVQAGGTVIGYLENRTDGHTEYRGFSTGTMVGGGMNLKLNSIFSSLGWDLYHSFGVHQYYLTLDYTRLSAPTGDLDISSNTFGVGLTYEF